MGLFLGWPPRLWEELAGVYVVLDGSLGGLRLGFAVQFLGLMHGYMKYRLF